MRALLLVAILAGCQNNTPSPAPTPAPTPAPVAAPAPIAIDAAAAPAPTAVPGDIPLEPFHTSLEGVELVDAGAEPRAPLRYHYVAGAKSNVMMEVDFDRKGPTGNGPLPTLVVGFVSEVKSVDAAGAGTVELLVTKLDEKARPGATVPAGEVAAQAALLTGASIITVVSPDGKTTDSKVALPARDMTAELVESATKQLKDYQELAMPLPAEPIGVGGRWRYTRHVAPLGNDVIATTTVEVTAIVGDRVSYTMTTAMTSPDRKMDSGSANLNLEIKNFHGEGSGKGVIALGATDSAAESTLKVTLDIVTEGVATTVEMSAATRMTAVADQGAHNAP